MEKTSNGWTTTVSGKRGPAVARWGKPISRNRAMGLLVFALNNACDYNVSEAYPLTITAIRVYGSYLTDKDPLGDIDIAVEYKEREPYASKPGWEQGYSPSNLDFIESLFFPKYEMCRFVKGRQFAISIGCESIEWMETPCVVIGFEEDGSRCQIAGVENIGGSDKARPQGRAPLYGDEEEGIERVVL